MGLLGSIGNSIGGLLGGGGAQPAQAPAGADGYPPPPPPMHGLGPIGDILDAAFLGGGINRVKRMEYNRELENYNRGLMYAEMPQLTPQQRIAAIYNPPKFGEEYAKNFAPVTTAAGATSTFGGGGAQGGGSVFGTQVGIDKESGLPYAMTPGGISVLGPTMGGDFSRGDGVISSGRTGGVAGTYSTNAPLPAGQTPGQFRPQVVGAPGAPGAPPQAGPQFNGLPNLFAPQPPTGGGDPGFARPITNQAGDPGFARNLPPGGAMGDPGFALGGAQGFAPVGTPMSAAVRATGAGGPAQGNGIDPQAFFRNFVAKQEGGLNPSDMNGSPTNMGFNQAANPDINVRNLTPQAAAQRFATNYYGPSGAANLPAPLAAVHADTYFINPKQAQTLLQQSGGDPAKYMAAREAWMQGMVQNNPKAAPYAQAWANRNAALRQYAGIGQGAPAGSAAAPGGAPGGQGGWQATGVAARPTLLTPQEAQAAGFAPDTKVERAADGKLSVVQAPEYGPEAKSNLRNHVLDSEAYKQAEAAQAAYKAMVANADKMTGPSAYSMLDTFARAINPGAVARPTVIETIEKNLGPLNHVQGSWSGLFGQGNLTPQVRQQVIDAVVPFVQSHWDQANMLNQANAALAKQHGFESSDVTAPLEGRPTRYQIAPPGAKVATVGSPADAQKLPPGTLFRTPDGQIRKRR